MTCCVCVANKSLRNALRKK